jgi:hypothetical protein
MTLLLNGFDLADNGSDWWGWTINGPGRLSGHVAPAARSDFFTEVAAARASVGTVIYSHGGGRYGSSVRRRIGPRQHWMADTSTGVIYVWNASSPGYLYSGESDAVALRWCCFTSGTLGTDFPSCTRFYFSTDNDVPISPAVDAAWDFFESGARFLLYATPQSTTAGGNAPWAAVSDPGVPSNWGNKQFLLALDGSGLPNPLSGTVHAQLQASSRNGIGVSEASQDMVSQMVIRVVSSDGGTVRGTALAAHSIASSAGLVKWVASTTERNSTFPPGAPAALTSVAWQSGDYLVVEVGARNFFDGVTGGTPFWNDTAASDLPEDETTTTNLRAWIDICG